jgi:hypothetical protein
LRRAYRTACLCLFHDSKAFFAFCFAIDASARIPFDDAASRARIAGFRARLRGPGRRRRAPGAACRRAAIRIRSAPEGSAAAARGAVQDIAYRTMRRLATAEWLIAKLVKKAPPPHVGHVLACALALLVDDEASAAYAPFTVVDQAVSAIGASRNRIREGSSQTPYCVISYANVRRCSAPRKLTK